MDRVESAEAIEAVDELLACAGLGHGRRETLKGSWKAGVRLERAKLPKPAASSAAANAIEVLRVPGWDRLRWLRHGFSTRAGGVSTVYDPGGAGSLNLGWTRPDEAANVLENRRRFLASVAGDGRRSAARPPESAAMLVGIWQFHSGMIRAVERQDLAADLEAADGRPRLRGDGLMTDVPGMMLGVSVADCVPVLVADVRRRAVAAFHAGWRGTLARIVERGIGAMRLRYGSRPGDLIAAVGPAIGECCYSVGEEVRHDFESQFAYAPELFSEVYDSDPVREKYPLLFLTARAPGHSNLGPRIHLNLGEANRRQLVDAGVPAGRIWVARECTACSRQGDRLKYFSHRGESGFAGRMMAAAGIDSENL